jgi:hypothetical protein
MIESLVYVREAGMVVVYLRNGEKAPMPDATYVRIDPADAANGIILRCFFGNEEVGHFKWDDVAGYTISAVNSIEQPRSSMTPWFDRLEN